MRCGHNLLTSGMMSPREAFQWLCAKGGPKDELDNYRFMVLLPAISRVIAKVIAVRLATWAQASKVLPPTQ